uniref:Uncharacterized protein n=1 Tax=Panagrolaimus sp. JU765 TaxID=591449 RepID=A0AC34REJ2_9BILA
MKKECKGEKSEDSDVSNENDGPNCVESVNDGTFDDKTGEENEKETEKKLSTGSNLSSNSIGSFDLLEPGNNGAAPIPTTEDHPKSETKDQSVNFEEDVANVLAISEGLEIPEKTQADVPENDEKSKTSADVGELPTKSDAEKNETTLATSENNEGAQTASSSHVLPKEKETPKTGSPKSPKIIIRHPDDSGQNKRKSSEIDENAAKIPHVPHVLEKDQKEKSAVESDEIVMLQRNSYFDHRLSAQINILMDEKIKKAQQSTSRRRAISETRSEDFLPDLTDSEAAIFRFLAENNRNVERQLEFKNVFRTLKFGDLFEKVTAADDRGVLNIYEISIIFMLSLAILVFFVSLL